jgi:hypothetical protein
MTDALKTPPKEYYLQFLAANPTVRCLGIVWTFQDYKDIKTLRKMKMQMTRQEGYKSNAEPGKRIDFEIEVDDGGTCVRTWQQPLYEDMLAFYPENDRAHDPGYFLQDYVYAYDYPLDVNKDQDGYDVIMKAFPALGGGIGGEEYMLACSHKPDYIKSKEPQLIFSPFNDHLAADPFESPWFYPAIANGAVKTYAEDPESRAVIGLYGVWGKLAKNGAYSTN